MIIGAGECGVRAAFALRENGYAGPVTLIGEEAHLPYERPPLSKGWHATPKPIASESAFSDAGIRLLRGTRVEAIEPTEHRLRLEDGAVLDYGKLLIATGARPRLFPGMEAALTLRTPEDAGAILDGLTPRSHLAIIGGGFIGLELAATARRAGVVVTVIEAADRLMARAVPAEIAAIAHARHTLEGVRFLFNAHVASATKTSVTLGNGEAIACERVVAGVGAVPNAELAEAAGLSVANGIVVDSSFRTSDPEIYAAGDCCSFPYQGRPVRLESWRAAQHHGHHAARAMLGDAAAYAKIPWFWSDQYDLTLQVAGLPEADRACIRRDVGEAAFILFQADDTGRLIAASGIGEGNAVARDIRLAEMLIERGVVCDPARLADPAFNLKAALKG